MYETVDRPFVDLINMLPHLEKGRSDILFSAITQTVYIVKIRMKLLKVLQLFVDPQMESLESSGYLDSAGDDIKQLLLTVSKQIASVSVQFLNAIVQSIGSEANLLRSFIELSVQLKNDNDGESIYHMKKIDYELVCLEKKLKTLNPKDTSMYLEGKMHRWYLDSRDKLLSKLQLFNLNLGDQFDKLPPCHYFEMLDRFSRENDALVTLMRLPNDFDRGINSFEIIFKSSYEPEAISYQVLKISLVSLLMLDPNMTYFYDVKLGASFFSRVVFSSSLVLSVILHGNHVEEADHNVNEFYKTFFMELATL